MNVPLFFFIHLLISHNSFCCFCFPKDAEMGIHQWETALFVFLDSHCWLPLPGMCYTPCLASSSFLLSLALVSLRTFCWAPHKPRGSHSSQIVFIQDGFYQAIVVLSQLAHKKCCTFLPILSFLTLSH